MSWAFDSNFCCREELEYFSKDFLPFCHLFLRLHYSIHAVNNRTLKILHIFPLFIEMLFCYQIWHTTEKIYDKKAINNGDAMQALRSFSEDSLLDSEPILGWNFSFLSRAFHRKRIFCSPTIWDFPFMFAIQAIFLYKTKIKGEESTEAQ
jgi:hypothetical protein